MLRVFRGQVLSLMFVISALSAFVAVPASARHGEFVSVLSSNAVGTDGDLVRAVNDRRYVRFLEAGNVVVSKILADDTQGLPHQRWFVKLSNGDQVFCVYNLDMAGRVPLKEGTVISLGGEFKWIRQGNQQMGLMHWLHRDPRHQHPDGYVVVNGVRYGAH